MWTLRSGVALAFPHGDGHLQREAELNRFAGEVQHSGGGPGQDPGRPGRERGDRSELLAFIAGVATGGLLGVVAAILADFIDIFAGVLGGVVLGGAVGAWLGGRLKRRAARKNAS